MNFPPLPNGGDGKVHSRTARALPVGVMTFAQGRCFATCQSLSIRLHAEFEERRVHCTGNIMWATRVWWMLRAFGFDGAAVLDGGFDKWKAQGRPVTTVPGSWPPARFEARLRPGFFADSDHVLTRLGDAGSVMVNALSPELHLGAGPSRYGRPGRVPGSVNVPSSSLLNPDDGTFVSLDEARREHEEAGVTPDRHVVAYCGGGISATVGLFLLHQLGYPELTLYDASMGEWARDSDLPIETGPVAGTSGERPRTSQ